MSYWTLAQTLRKSRYVDLTHPMDIEIPHFFKAVPMDKEHVATIDRDGYSVQRFSFEGQWGTHADAPSHFIDGLKTLDAIDVRDMILPLAVIDVSGKVALDQDYALTAADIADYEEQYGIIPEGAFIAMRSDWSKRWPDQEKFLNRDQQGRQRTPGWSLQALRFLVEERGVVAIGHETIDTDPGLLGAKSGFAAEHYILSKNLYQIELMANLNQADQSGGMVVAAFPKVKGASGFPARVFALFSS